MNKRKITLIIISLILALFLLVEGLYLVVVPRYLNSLFKTHKVESLIKDKTGLILSYKSASVKTTPIFNLGLSFTDVLLTDTSGAKIFSAGDCESVLRLSSLIFKKVVFKNISANNLYFEISRNKDEKFYLGEYPLNLDFKGIKDFDVEVKNLNASDLTVLLNDKFQNKKINAKVLDTQLYYKENESLKGVLKAEIYINDKKKSLVDMAYESKLPLSNKINKNNFEFNGFIKNLDLSDYSSYLTYFSKNDIQFVSGIIDADFSTEKDFKINASLKDFAVKMANPLDSIKADSDIFLASELSLGDKVLHLKQVNLRGKTWAIDVSGSIKNYKDKKSKLDLVVKLPKSDIHSLYNLIPSIKGDPQESIQKFKKHGAWGDIEGELQIKGDSSKPEVYGGVNLSNVYIVKFNPDVPKCKVAVKFLKDKVKVTTRVFMGFDQYVDVDGIAEMKVNGKGDFHVNSSKRVNLSNVKYILIPIHEVVGFDLGPVPYMDLAGTGNIDIYTKGSVVEGEVTGALHFENATASLNGLNTVLEKASGTLVFDRKDMHFYTTNANIKNQPLKVDGTANLSGDIDFDVKSSSVDIKDLFDILKTSPMLKDKNTMVEPIEAISGKVDTAIKIKGKVEDFGKFLNNDSMKISGTLLLKNSVLKLKMAPLSLRNLSGKIEFNDVDWKVNLSALLGGSKININGASNGGHVSIKTGGEALKTDELIDLITKIEKNKYLNHPKTNSLITFSGEYKSNSPEFDFTKIKAQGWFAPMKNNQETPFLISSGSFKLSNGDLNITNFNAKLFNTKILAGGKISDLFTEKRSVDGHLNITNFDISSFNSLKKISGLPPHLKKLMNAYEDYEGIANVLVTSRKSNLSGVIELKDIKFNHSYFKTPVVIDSGNIILDGKKLTLKSLIAQVDGIPVFINASVWDLDKTAKFSGYFTTKFTEVFANKYVNGYLTYPLKPRGDITVTADIDGTAEHFRIRPKIKFAQDADLYYMGANFGDESDEREIKADVTVSGNIYYIKKADYIRYMTSQNDRVYPLTILTANGVVQIENKKTFIRNLNVETLNNANVKMFNAVFKKSVLKNGMFHGKLNIKGEIDNPQVLGNVYLDNLDMPLYDTLVKNAAIRFKDKVIEVKTNGLIFDSDFSLKASFVNKFKPPYIVENIEIYSEKLNLDKMIDSLTGVPTPNTAVKMDEVSKIPFNVSDIIIKNGSMTADDMIIRGLGAKNYHSEFKLGDDFVLRLGEIGFDVTTGKVLGIASYDFKNGRIKADLSAVDVDSNKVASTLFDFKDQIFGQANGNLIMTTTGKTENERIKNLHGYVYFDIVDGKMPKLGSVEYLLKAGNVIKSGITGASISNLLDLIAPVKTGYFDSIKGKLALKNGVAQNIEVYSKGENLNLYMSGEYDILQQYANMRVYGRLTKKASNVLGVVGNLSFNTILNTIPGFKLDKEDKLRVIQDLNKIPGVELSELRYRVFTAKIDGKINEEKYVKSFRWIE